MIQEPGRAQGEEVVAGADAERCCLLPGRQCEPAPRERAETGAAAAGRAAWLGTS